MKRTTIIALAVALASCNKEPQFVSGAESSDRAPQAIIKDGKVYQYLSGEYVPIPVSNELPSDKQSRSFDSNIGPKLTAKIKLFYAYGEAHYQVNITLKDTKNKSVKEISDELQKEFSKTAPYTIKFLQNGFGIENVNISTPARVIESYGKDGEDNVGLYQSDGSFLIGPSKFTSIDDATMTWH